MVTALLVMDMQNGVVARLGERGDGLVASVARALEAARAAGVEAIFVRVAFRPGAPEISGRNATFARLAASDDMREDAEATQVHAALAPRPDEVVVTKRRVSAFSGSDLDVVLRARGVDRLVLSGVATSGVVLSTVRQAADLDFQLVVLRDACADGDEEVHRVLMDKVFPRQADVMSVDEWTAGL